MVALCPLYSDNHGMLRVFVVFYVFFMFLVVFFSVGYSYGSCLIQINDDDADDDRYLHKRVHLPRLALYPVWIQGK